MLVRDHGGIGFVVIQQAGTGCSSSSAAPTAPDHRAARARDVAAAAGTLADPTGELSVFTDRITVWPAPAPPPDKHQGPVSPVGGHGA